MYFCHLRKKNNPRVKFFTRRWFSKELFPWRQKTLTGSIPHAGKNKKTRRFLQSRSFFFFSFARVDRKKRAHFRLGTQSGTSRFGRELVLYGEGCVLLVVGLARTATVIEKMFQCTGGGAIWKSHFPLEWAREEGRPVLIAREKVWGNKNRRYFSKALLRKKLLGPILWAINLGKLWRKLRGRDFWTFFSFTWKTCF